MSNNLADILVKSKYFDYIFYAEQTGILFSDKISAVAHYIETGHKSSYRTSIYFDPAYYLESNADVAEAGLDALSHFVQYGVKENRRPLLSRSPRAHHPQAPDDLIWDYLAEIKSEVQSSDNAGKYASVDVVIPVYRGYSDTLACIESVINAKNKTNYELVVIDDKSPDLELSQKLDYLSRMGLITLLKNHQNLGFVGTVNRGMQLNTKRDVILLNSDTIVYGNWIDRLRAQAYQSERVASVTPFSNNATIFSYPYTLRSNNQQLEIDFSDLDSIAADVNKGQFGVVPTGVGFCFYLRRDALNEIGYFDQDLFGKGYGEENDYCMRAIEHGWVNLAAYDTFVRHTGEVSFAAGASQGKREGFRRLVAAHPRYEGLIAEYVQRDPMRQARSKMDVARFAKASDGRGILMVEHGWGGGIEKHIEDLVDLASKEAIPVIICKASKSQNHPLKIVDSDDYPNLPNIDWNNVDDAADILLSLRLGRVHIHSLVGFSDTEIGNMLKSIEKSGLKYDFTVHDYSPICPRITMIDWGGSYCDTPSRSYCELCLKRSGSQFGDVNINRWIDLYRLIFDGAENIYVPSSDVAERLRGNGRLDYSYIVRPHPDRNYAKASKPMFKKDIVRTIGIIGAIGPHKGSRLLRAMSADAFSRKLPLKFVVYGYTDFDSEDYHDNITVLGSYKDELFSEMFSEHPCDIALFLSMWPETFCYSLDHAFSNMIYPVTFSLGAPAERIRMAGFGSVIDRKYMFSPAIMNDIVLSLDVSTDVESVSEPERAWKSIKAYYSSAAW